MAYGRRVIVGAQWVLLAGWLVGAVVFIGWGLLVRHLWGESRGTGGDDLLLTFWLGWTAVLLALQIWHLLLPVDGWAQVVVATVGALGAVFAGGLRWAWRSARSGLYRWPAVVGMALGALWLSNRALEGSRFGDTGGYYVPTIRWVIEQPVIIGLGNLYAPYAYNQSYFLYAALLEVGAFVRHTHHLLNSLLLMTLVARTMLALWRLLRGGHAARMVDIYWALLLPAELAAATGFLFTSPAPDFAVFVFGIVLFGELIALLATPSVPGSDGGLRLHFLSLAWFAALAPTIKLPITGLALSAMLVGTLVWLRRMRARPRPLVVGLALAALFGLLSLGPWVTGNVLMTGCPFFPSAAGALPVDWRVNLDIQRWIQNTMYMGDLRVVWNQPRWLAQRFDALGWSERDVVVPALMTAAAIAVGLIAGVVRLLRRRGRPAHRLSAWALLPPFVSLVFVVATTPVPRYAGATMWLLAAAAVMVGLGGWLASPIGRRVAVAAAIAVSALVFPRTVPLWMDIHDFPPNPRSPVEQRRLDSGLELWVAPPNYPACWDAPLPCTPQVQVGLRLRRPGELRSGFSVDRMAVGPTQP